MTESHGVNYLLKKKKKCCNLYEDIFVTVDSFRDWVHCSDGGAALGGGLTDGARARAVGRAPTGCGALLSLGGEHLRT